MYPILTENGCAWSPSIVEMRLAEAAMVWNRLPEERRREYCRMLPEIAQEFCRKTEKNRTSMTTRPSGQMVDRMEETLTWIAGLEPIDRQILLLRALGVRWKEVCWKVGLNRSAAHQHWRFGISVITLRLNDCPIDGSLSMRKVIELTHAVKS